MSECELVVGERPLPSGRCLMASSSHTESCLQKEPSSKRVLLVVVNFDLDSEVPLVRRACRLMYVSVHSGRQAAGPAMRSVCVHEDKGLRGHRVPDLLTTTITIGLTNPLVALHVKLTLSSQSDSRHSVSPP